MHMLKMKDIWACYCPIKKFKGLLNKGMEAVVYLINQQLKFGCTKLKSHRIDLSDGVLSVLATWSIKVKKISFSHLK